MRLSTMRLTILLAMGFQVSCVTSGAFVDDDATDDDTGEPNTVARTCDEVPLATKENAREVESSGSQWLVCGPKPADESCATASEMQSSTNSWRFLMEQLGPTTDADFCSWDGQVVCGPEESITDQCCYVLKSGSCVRAGRFA